MNSTRIPEPQREMPEFITIDINLITIKLIKKIILLKIYKEFNLNSAKYSFSHPLNYFNLFFYINYNQLKKSHLLMCVVSSRWHELQLYRKNIFLKFFSTYDKKFSFNNEILRGINAFQPWTM